MTTYKYTEGYTTTGTVCPHSGSWKMVGPVATVTTYNLNEPDTYTLIPNGKEYYKRANAKGKYIDAYIVQHDQTGSTIPYLGPSEMWYKFFSETGIWRYGNKSVFYTFAMWDKNYRNKWKETQVALIKEEGQKPMSLTLECVPCANKSQPPIKHSNNYIQYVLNPPMDWWTVDNLKKEYALLLECVDSANEYDECTDDYYDTLGKLEEAIEYFEKKGNNNMYNTSNTAIVAAPQPESVEQREYLLVRLDKLARMKRKELHSHFKLDPTTAPKTFREVVEKLKSGDFSIDDKLMDMELSYGAHELIFNVRWTKDKADQAGYDAAVKKMDAAQTDTTDIVKILSPEEGLKALQKFEEQTFR